MNKIAVLFQNLRIRVAEFADLRDIHAYGGLAMFGYGIHMIAPWAAFALCGAILFWIGIRR